MKLIWNITSWIVSIIAFLVAPAAFSVSTASGACLVLAGFMALPPLRYRLHLKTGITIPAKARVIYIALLFMASTAILNIQIASERKSTSTTSQDASQATTQDRNGQNANKPSNKKTTFKLPDKLNAQSLAGMSYRKLEEKFGVSFPNDIDPDWGIVAEVKNVHGWKKIIFHLNGAKNLSSVDFIFKQGPIPQAAAIQVGQEQLGLPLLSRYRVEPPSGILAFRELPSPLRTVNLIHYSERKHETDILSNDKISRISVFYRIGWDE